MPFIEVYLAGLLAVSTIRVGEAVWSWWRARKISEDSNIAPAQYSTNPFESDTDGRHYTTL